MASLNPYLNFDGNAEEAMEFYRSVFGGEFMGGGAMRWKDAPGCGEGEGKLSDADGQKVMHMALPVPGGSMIMASDIMESFGQTHKPGNSFYIAIGPDSREDADRLFAGLSDGGEVEMPMADAFWGGYFGSFTDKFGVNWLINYGGQAES